MDVIWTDPSCMKVQEVWTRYNWRGPTYVSKWLYMLFRRFSICIRNICLMYNYRVYNNLFWIVLTQMEYQSMYYQMVGRAASVVSPFYSILLVYVPFTTVTVGWENLILLYLLKLNIFFFSCSSYVNVTCGFLQQARK